MSLTPPLMTGWSSSQTYEPLTTHRLDRIERLLELILKRLSI